jgi:hypothetical protein
MSRYLIFAPTKFLLKNDNMEVQNSILLLSNLEEKVEKSIQVAIEKFQNLPFEILLKHSFSGG